MSELQRQAILFDIYRERLRQHEKFDAGRNCRWGV